MKHNFLESSKFIIVDYVPGSSGQLFLRLWSELDSRINNSSNKIMSTTPINENLSSTEIFYDITITKKIVNWFLEKAEPSTINEYINFFETLGNFLVAQQQPWNKESTVKFLENGIDIEYPPIVLYAMHTKHVELPLQLKTLVPNLEILSIVPNTKLGNEYQLKRAEACYNQRASDWNSIISKFNNKSHAERFDFCSMLANKDSTLILDYLKEKIGPSCFLDNKVDKAMLILDTYYKTVVDNLELSYV